MMLKLPPPILALIYVFASAISWRLGWPKIPGLPFAALGIALAVAACILPILAILLFRREGTEVSPTSPTNQKLVISTPMAAVQRAIQISRQPIFPKKDVLAVFDISQPSAKKRFYVLDFKTGQVTAHYAAHGRDNGPNAKAIKFKGFQTDLDMVPLGPLKTAHSEVMEPYKKIVDRYDEAFIQT